MKPPAEGSANSLRVDLQGDDVFALVQRYRTKSPEEGFWEAHRRYIDVQCVIEGAENMGCAPLESMRITQPYDAEKDYVMLAPRRPEDVNYVCVPEGMFAIFMPHDAHFPGLAVGGKIASVKKIVVKVAV